MTEQRRRGKYPDEMRERAVRMVFEAQRHCGSQWEAISSVAEKLGPTPETVRKWVRRTEVDEGRRPGLSSEERERLKRLERENRELRRANEIKSSTVARNTGPSPVSICLKSPTHFSLTPPAVKSRRSRSGTGSARLSGRVRPLRRLGARPCRPWRAMDASTVFLDALRPDRRSAARTLGEP